jgi:hypothetical protein
MIEHGTAITIHEAHQLKGGAKEQMRLVGDRLTRIRNEHQAKQQATHWDQFYRVGSADKVSIMLMNRSALRAWQTNTCTNTAAIGRIGERFRGKVSPINELVASLKDDTPNDITHRP